MRVPFVLAVLACALLPATAAAQSAAPAAETAAAGDVAETTATLVGKVNPNRSATTYRFEYGTTTDYGLETVARSAGNGSLPVDVTAAVANLSRATTYHYRVVAVNAQGEDRGEDVTFTTAAAPAEPITPRAYQLHLEANSPTAPVVRATINPRGSPTTWRVEYGHTTAFGLATPDQPLPAGIDDVVVTAAVPGVEPGRRVWWRVVAANGAGIRRSRRARFTTQRAPTGVTLSPGRAVVPWGRRVTLRGQVAGLGIGGIPVALQREAFSFGAGLADAGTVRADVAGAFVFDAGPLLLTTRFQVQTRTPAPVQSPLVTVFSAVRVGVAPGVAGRRRVPVTGKVRPPVPSGLAALQRRRPDGRWRTVRRARLADVATYSRYRFLAPRLRTSQVYRVRVAPRDGGAHVAGAGRAFRVPARR
jgi:hypothetical protein